MATDSRITLEARIRAGVTHAEVETALRKLLNEADHTALATTHAPEGHFNVLGLVGDHLLIRFDLELSDRFDFDEFVAAVGALAREPFEACVEDQETGDAEERYTYVTGGPEAMIPEFHAAQAAAEIRATLGPVSLPPGAGSIDDLVVYPCMTVYTHDVSRADAVAEPRISVDLQGLVIDSERRERIARLSALIARELAEVPGLTVTAAPGRGAADWVLKEVESIQLQAKALDDDLDDAANGGANARPPDGDHYNELSEAINVWANRVRAWGDALTVVPQMFDTSSEPLDAPRG